MDESGRFVVDGLEAGPWRVSTDPLKQSGGDREIMIAKSDVDLSLTLTVQGK